MLYVDSRKGLRNLKESVFLRHSTNRPLGIYEISRSECATSIIPPFVIHNTDLVTCKKLLAN
jgi:hypothetical protein